MADDLSHYCETREVFLKNQFGGRPAQTTMDSMLLLTHTIKESWRQGKVTSVLFLDVQGAFPNVIKEVLIHNMYTQSIPTKYIRLIELMLTGHKTKLLFDDFLSNFIPINNGNNQGCTLLMLNHAFYNAGLLEITPPDAMDEAVFGFVDDITILSIGKTFTVTHRKLGHMMGQPGGAFNWSESHNSQYELSKLALMDFSPKPYQESTLTISHPCTNRSTMVKSVKMYQFLSVLFDPKLKWMAQTERVARSGEAWINLIRRLMHTSTGLLAKAI